ncbi:hypothetical protein O4J55_19905, partial [Paracoccus sp. PXZ]
VLSQGAAAGAGDLGAAQRRAVALACLTADFSAQPGKGVNKSTLADASPRIMRGLCRLHSAAP